MWNWHLNARYMRRCNGWILKSDFRCRRVYLFDEKNKALGFWYGAKLGVDTDGVQGCVFSIE